MSDYDQLIEEVQAGIDEASRKVTDGRMRDIENEELRLQYLNTLNDLVNTKRVILEVKKSDDPTPRLKDNE